MPEKARPVVPAAPSPNAAGPAGVAGRPEAAANAGTAQVAITFNRRTYRFDCPAAEAERLGAVAEYVRGKLDTLMLEHGAIGDERLMLMVALTLADELFDARADVDDLLSDTSAKPRAAGG